MTKDYDQKTEGYDSEGCYTGTPTTDDDIVERAFMQTKIKITDAPYPKLKYIYKIDRYVEEAGTYFDLKGLLEHSMKLSGADGWRYREMIQKIENNGYIILLVIYEKIE